MRLVPPEINNPQKGGILVVGRDPGEQEVIDERPFVGKAGQELDYVLSFAGFRREDVNISNTVGVRPPNNDFKKHDEMDVERGRVALMGLINQLRPKLIITLGNEASYTLIDGWPSNGRLVYGAKGIEDRRGYFWEGPNGSLILATLHPAGVLRSPVPGRYLLQTDFRRARRYLDGDLSREEFPHWKSLDRGAYNDLCKSELVSFDIETKWGNTATLCCGFCGDDLQPYVALAGSDAWHWAVKLLQNPNVKLVAHNGQFDLYALKQMDGIDVRGYQHDTLLEWYALEPELAGRSGSGREGGTGTRMTRKGLAFLASLYFNVPWWKDYPDSDNPYHDELMLELNARDVWVTRDLHNSLAWEIAQDDVWDQYRMAMNLIPACLTIQERGIRVDDNLRRERFKELNYRVEEQESQAREAGLAYVSDIELPEFRVEKRCECCMGGKVARQQCWRCAGFSEKPNKSHLVEAFGGDPKLKKAELEAVFLKPCEKCEGVGKLTSYEFNPFSTEQLKQLLYNHIGAPRSVWKGRETIDEIAMKRIWKWANQGKSGGGG